MKTIYNSAILILIGFLMLSCTGSNKTDTIKNEVAIASTPENTSVNNTADTSTIYVYYFHGSIRCHTCVSVDEDTHKYLKEFYPEMFDNGKMIFQSLNADEDERLDLIKKYKIWGQTLLFIKGDKVVDMTEDAFMYVTTDPDKWKNIVKENMDKLVKS